jgi:hypothetical protein
VSVRVSTLFFRGIVDEPKQPEFAAQAIDRFKPVPVERKDQQRLGVA